MNNYSSRKQASLKGKVSFTHLDDSSSQGLFHHRSRVKAYRAILTSIESPNRVLDLGCSIGAWSETWKELGFTYLIGADPNEIVKSQASERFDEFYSMDAVNLQKVLIKQDFIAANAVVLHITQQDELSHFYSSVSNMLSDNGIFVVSIVNPARYMGARTYGNLGETFAFYSLEENFQILEQSNLRIEKVVGTFIEPWSTVNFDFLANSNAYSRNDDLWKPFELLADLIRETNFVEFSEVLVVCRRL